MRAPTLAQLMGAVVGAAVLIAALMIWLSDPVVHAGLVQTLPGQNGVAAELYRGKTGETGGTVDLVKITGADRSVEVLRLDGPTPALRWLDPDTLQVCVGDAEVYHYVPEARVGAVTVEVVVAPLPAADCGG